MKRPGGFDREPEPAQQPGAVPRPEAEQRIDRAPATEAVQVGSVQLGAVAPVVDPDAQPTDVIDDAVLAGVGDSDAPAGLPGGTADAASGPDSRPDGRANAEKGLAVPRAAVSRALVWVGVGAPKDPVRAADRRLRRAASSRRRRERGERLRFAAQLRKQRRGWLIAGGAIVALALFVAVTAFTPLTAVREVRVEGAQAVSEDELVRALQRFDGVPLALVEDAEVHRALEVFPLIQRYQVERIPPHTLLVQIAERVPVIAIERNGSFEQFDAAGVRVGAGEAPVPGVPVGSGSVADLTSPAFASAARTVRDMPQELRARVVAVTATSAQDVTLTLDSGLEVLWGGDVDIARKSVVLQAMLAALGERPLTRIDVSSPDAPVFQ